MNKDKKTKLIILIVTVFVVLAIAITAAVIIISNPKKGNKNTDQNVPESTTAAGQTAVTNLDGTPIEIEMYYDEEGRPVVNNEGYQVYQVKNTYDSNGQPVLVIRSPEMSENGFSYIIQIKDGDVISNKTDENGNTQTTVFSGDPSKIPQASQDNQSGTTVANTTGEKNNQTQPNVDTSDANNQNTTGKTDNNTTARELPDEIDLGGVYGIVKRDETKGKNVYKGNFVASEMPDLKTPVTYDKLGYTFTKGIYLPSKIGDYNVVQLAYVRLYTYYDEAFGEYDWYSMRGIFKPGNDNDPIVYLGKNDTFNIESDVQNLHNIFLIELS